MKHSRKSADKSPALPRKSLSPKHLSPSPPEAAEANCGVRTGDKKNQPKKSMLTRAEVLEAFLQVCSMYGRRAKGVKKTMSPAAIEQRRAAGKASALKRGFVTDVAE